MNGPRHSIQVIHNFEKVISMEHNFSLPKNILRCSVWPQRAKCCELQRWRCLDTVILCHLKHTLFSSVGSHIKTTKCYFWHLEVINKCVQSVDTHAMWKRIHIYSVEMVLELNFEIKETTFSLKSFSISLRFFSHPFGIFEFSVGIRNKLMV